MSKLIYCNSCGKRVNGAYAVRTNRGLLYYCKEHYCELVPEEPVTDRCKCMYCTNFKYAKDKWWNLIKFTVLRTNVSAIYGECGLHDKTVSTLSCACSDFNDGFGGRTPFCSEEKILKAAVNDWCRNEKNFNCDECSTRSFWLEVLEAKDVHIINDSNQVLSFTTGEGGFYNDRFNIEFEDGTVLKNMGLWSRGHCPNKLIYDKIRHAKVTPYTGE